MPLWRLILSKCCLILRVGCVCLHVSLVKHLTARGEDEIRVGVDEGGGDQEESSSGTSGSAERGLC